MADTPDLFEMAQCAKLVSDAMKNAKEPLDRHSLEVFRDALRTEIITGVKSNFEIVQEGLGRRVDSVSTQVIDAVKTIIHTETKTGGQSISEAIGGAKNKEQFFTDAFQLAQNFYERLEKTTTEGMQKVWRFADKQFGDDLPVGIERRMTELVRGMAASGFPKEAIDAVVAGLKFRDQDYNEISATLSKEGALIFAKNGEKIFEVGMETLLGPDGKFAQKVEEKAAHSPNFDPAMEILLGANGKLAGAASEAAGATNLDAAMAGLEQKVESGVETALDQAGTNAQAHAASKLGANIKEGVGALGNTLTSVAGLGNQVIALGEAWDKPKKSAADYFNLMGQFGGTISQGLGAVDAIQKLGAAMSSLGIMTKIAAAAQAVFNAIMAINPVVLVVIAVVALIAVIVALIVYWDQVKAALRDNPWLAVVAALFGVIGVIVLVIAYWDEIKLAVLIAANFMSIQLQKIGGFFVGLKNIIVMVWDWVVASVYNLGVGILNTFIEFGAGIVNFFIDLLNDFIGIYNDIAYYVPGLDEISKVERVNVEAIKVATKEVPEIDVGKAFAHQGEIKGGLEDQIAKQEQVVKAAQDEDKTRQQKAAEQKAAEERQAAAAAPAGAPAIPTAFGGPAAAPAPAPALGAGAVAGGPDQSVHVEGGIHVTINAEGLDAGSARMLTDDMVRQIQERLDSLRSERDRRVGVRTAAAA
jgi:hypothetical protein